MEGVDYSFSRPSPTGLYSAGKRFAMRYIGPGTSPKHLSVSEANGLKAAGLSLVTLVEGAVGDPKGGFGVGVAHARSAVAMLKARGFPTNRPMYFAIDYDVSLTSWSAAREYLRGAGSVIGPSLVGIYGEYNAMEWAARDGVAAWFFQTYAWSGGRWYSGNHVEQYRNNQNVAGGDVDLCRSKKADFGQWGQSVSTPIGEDDMQFIAHLVGPAEGQQHWAVGNGLEYAHILTWDEHEARIAAGAKEKTFKHNGTDYGDWQGWTGRTLAGGGGGTATVDVSQDMLNAAIAANVDDLAEAIMRRIKIL